MSHSDSGQNYKPISIYKKWELGIVSETAVVFLYNCVIFLIFARVGLAVFIRVVIFKLIVSIKIYLKATHIGALRAVRRCVNGAINELR